MGNRVQNYLTDLAYALDYAYTTKCSTKPTICDGQAQRLQYVTGNTVSINGQSTVIACCNDGTGSHCDDLITAVLNLRNPKNQTNVVAACMRADVCAYDANGQLITGSIVKRESGQAKTPAKNVCEACGYYTAYGATGTAGTNATHNCGILTIGLPTGYYENASVCILGSCNRTTPPAYGTCVMIDCASQYPYSSGYLVASGVGTVRAGSNTYYARHNYGDVAIKIPEGYYPNGYTTNMKGAELKNASNVAATLGAQGYVCIDAGYTSGFKCCWNMAGTSYISETCVACGCTYVDSTGKLRTGSYVVPSCTDGCIVVTTNAKCYLVDSTCLAIRIYDCYKMCYVNCYITGNIVAMCVERSEADEGYLYTKFRFYGTYSGVNCTFDYKYGYFACIYSCTSSYKYLYWHFVNLNALHGILNYSW